MILMMVGVQGSGKSTYAAHLAKEYGIQIISTDFVRMNNPGIQERFVWLTVYKQVYVACKQKRDVVFDATNITKKVRARFFKEVNELGLTPEVGVYYMNEDLEVCLKRVDKRNKNECELYLPLDVLESYYKNKEEPSLDEGFAFIKKVVDGKVVETVYSESYEKRENRKY